MLCWAVCFVHDLILRLRSLLLCALLELYAQLNCGSPLRFFNSYIFVSLMLFGSVFVFFFRVFNSLEASLLASVLFAALHVPIRVAA